MSTKIKVKRDKLIEQLTRVCSIVEKRVDFPSLGFLLCQFEKDQLRITSSNLSMELSTNLSLEESINEDFAVLVPARKLYNLCRNIQDDEVKLEFSAKTLKLSSAQGSFKMSTMNEDQFPLLDFEEKGEGFDLSAAVLLRAFHYTRNFIAPETSRAVLQGVYCELAAKNLVAVATDGHRMACCQSSVETEVETQFILPRRSVNELINHIDSDAEKIRIEYRDGYVRFYCGDFKLTTRLVEGNYPDFRAVIPPDETDNRARLNCEQYNNALKAIQVLINESTQSVLCDFSKNKLTLKTYNNDTDEGEIAIEAEYSGEPISIIFNIKYLFDVLSSIRSENVEIFLQDHSKSCLMKKTEKEETSVNEVRFIVMPMGK